MADINSMPARERILELLSYDPDTGRLTWRRRANNNGRQKDQKPATSARALGIDLLVSAARTSLHIV